MLELEKVKTFYETDLKEKLTSLEVLRKRVTMQYKLIPLVIVGAIGLFILYKQVVFLLPESFMSFMRYTPHVIGIAAIALIIMIVIKISKKSKAYRIAFKENVVSEVIKIFDPDWNYSYSSCISQSEYLESGIFKTSLDRYKGDDLVTGKIKNTDFKFSELHSEYKTTTTDSKGNRKTTWHTVFKGLFFHADFNKTIKGTTFVLPDTAESMFGKFGQKLQSMNKTYGKLVKLENIEFEKKFVVYSSDQVEARYVLTPKMMEKIVNIKNKYSKNALRLSFVGSRVYCAISFSKNLFEPRTFSSGILFTDIEEMYDLLSLIETIIEEMELNTRIWTKD